ncbi:MAG: hypothetical protein K0Q99_363 [Clostridia bacterium]|jgi:heptaprenylglyceryl phosphate synthase|nr:hypothetical protein [Clostridia bacterium]
MRLIKVSFGHLVLLMPDEQGVEAVDEKIAQLKRMGKVAIIISGSENPIEVISRLM